MGTENELAEEHCEDEVQKEQLVHGGKWQSVFGGYFSDLEMATPFLSEIAAALLSAPPQIIVDLGGGTGFILEQLLARNMLEGAVLLINLDISEEQQRGIEDAGIEKS